MRWMKREKLKFGFGGEGGGIDQNRVTAPKRVYHISNQLFFLNSVGFF